MSRSASLIEVWSDKTVMALTLVIPISSRQRLGCLCLLVSCRLSRRQRHNVHPLWMNRWSVVDVRLVFACLAHVTVNRFTIHYLVTQSAVCVCVCACECYLIFWECSTVENTRLFTVVN